MGVHSPIPALTLIQLLVIFLDFTQLRQFPGFQMDLQQH